MAAPVSLRPIDQLRNDPNNARTHSEAQIEQIAASIVEFGFAVPVAADAQGIIRAGNGRFDAIKLLLARGQSIFWPDGVAIEDGHIPAIDCSAWSEAQCRAYALADNKIALNAGWNQEMVDAELAALSAMDFQIGLTGFDDSDLRDGLARIANLGRTGEDDEIEPPVAPVSRLGDIWLLGEHRIGCGDSTDADTVARVLAGAKPNLMVTDPPYGVEYDASWRDELGIDWTGQSEKKTQRLSTHKNATPNKSRSLGKVENDDRADWSDAWELFPGSIAYVWHGGLHAAVVQESLMKSKFVVRAQIIWVKQHFVFSRGDYHWRHEPCWYAVRGSGNWIGDRKQTTVWEIANASAFHGDKDDKTTGHSTQKPVECMKRPIENNSKPGDFVYEPFSGSGTNIIACEMTGRKCLAIELSPAYVDMALLRFEQFTGQTATLEGGGTYAETAAARGVELPDA